MFTPGTKVRSIHRIKYTDRVPSESCALCGHAPMSAIELIVGFDTPGVVTELHMTAHKTEIKVRFQGHEHELPIPVNEFIGVRKENEDE